MKTILRGFLIDVIVLYLLSSLFSGLAFERGTISLVFAGAGLYVSSLLVKPIINLLLLPINLLTFGLFRWASSAIALYLVTLVVPGFGVKFFSFAGLSTKWMDIPALHFEGLIAFIAFSFAISFITSIIHWLIK